MSISPKPFISQKSPSRLAKSPLLLKLMNKREASTAPFIFQKVCLTSVESLYLQNISLFYHCCTTFRKNINQEGKDDLRGTLTTPFELFCMISKGGELYYFWKDGDQKQLLTFIHTVGSRRDETRAIIGHKS